MSKASQERSLSARIGRSVQSVSKRESIAAALAIFCCALPAETAQAETTVIQLSRMENGYSAPGAYASPTTNITYSNLSTPKYIEGSATLTLHVNGNFDGASESLEVYIENEMVANVFTGVQPAAICHQNGSSFPTPLSVSISIDASVLNPLISDGKTEITLKPTSPGYVCYDNENPCYSLRVASGTFTLNGKTPPAEEKAVTASTLSKSRTTVTISNLPNLSGRMSRVSFSSAPAAPAPSAPTPRAPAPSAPTPGLPGGGSPQSGAGLPGGGGSSGGGVVISGGGTGSSGNFSFSGDLSGMRNAAAAKELASRAARYGESGQAAAYRMRNGFDGGAEATAEEEALAAARNQALGFDFMPQEQAFDVWFGGSFSYFDAELAGIGQTGGVGSLQFGVDTRLSEDLLLGVAVFGDILRSDSSTGSQSHGLGVMAGPYAVIGLHENLYLELMAAYGRAFNRINTSGLADARYQSERKLATARLSGDWVDGPWSIRPSARVTYYSERQESFDAGDGSIVAEEEAVLGQLRFGPELGHNLVLESGYARPFIGFEGVWAFKQTEQIVEGVPTASEELTGSLSFGLDALFDGAALRAAGRYDGVGEPRLDTMSGEVTLRVPLQ